MAKMAKYYSRSLYRVLSRRYQGVIRTGPERMCSFSNQVQLDKSNQIKSIPRSCQKSHLIEKDKAKDYAFLQGTRPRGLPTS